MKLNGQLILPASPEQLWNLLLDPQVLAEILPDCQELTSSQPDHYEGLIAAKIGPISSQYTARFVITDKNPPHRHRLTIEGEGKGGFLHAEAHVRLEPQNGKTILHYEGEGEVGGAIARIGQRLIEVAAKKLVEKGMKALKKKVEEKLKA